MAHSPETKAAVRRSYIFDRLGLEAAAERHGVSLPTARRWKSAASAAGDDWDKARAASALSHSGATNIAQLVLADFLTLHQATVDGLNNAPDIPPLARAEAMSRLADAFTKTMNAIARAAPDLGRHAVAVEVLHDLTRYVVEEHKDLAPVLVEVLEPFGTMLAEKYG